MDNRNTRDICNVNWSYEVSKAIICWLTTYDLRLTTYDLRLTTYDLRLTTYDLRLTTNTVLNNQNKYQLLKSLEQGTNITQRKLSKELGISLGKVNYCLQSLIQKGFIKINNFKNSNNKIQYSYLLTPQGVEEKTKLTIEFLKAKTKEYEVLKKEVERINEERRAGKWKSQ